MDKDTLQILQVIDRLTVGPVRIENKRIQCPYAVIQNGEESTNTLEYAYEEPVFDPNSTASANLAAMICAQVVLNYGLFCNQIVFHGPFDKHDQAFIRDMMANTSREIYVIKLLQHNPFLKGSVANLPIVNLKNYTQAEILFPDAISAPVGNNWQSDYSKFAISSSGGKDSLLSDNLLRELDYETHPIYINESGRHWYTALNAYRHYKERHAETARVWTNADRIYNWMLRHFPFIRSDYASIRADEYPIRLWTVAVFLFGTLPLLKKRGIGCLVIGDENDTTRRLTYKGIPHYDGLYDQSRYFDEALTRYFIKKGWGIRQFSLLRPLSELLIEDILVKRYPDYQRQQMSCHATHIENDRVYPCGKCEKCRRIVGMLLALDADPRQCGYSNMQIQHCLTALENHPPHQEAAGSQHLTALLIEKGLIRPGNARAKLHPEIMQLRFDNERAPFSYMPQSLREKLYALFMQHASGALLRKGQSWEPIDPLNENAMTAPYPFEFKTEGTNLDY